MLRELYKLITTESSFEIEIKTHKKEIIRQVKKIEEEK